MNTNLEFNYFVIIILILFCISKSFLFGLHTTFLITALSVVKKTLIPACLNNEFCMNIPDLSQLAIPYFRIRRTISHKGIQIYSCFYRLAGFG